MKRIVLPALLLAAGPAFAHPLDPQALAGDVPGWSLDPWITGPLALTAGLWGVGALRLWRRSGLGRDRLGRRGWTFAGGWLALAAAVVSPLHQAGERSFAFHMLEHEMLMLVAAPLLVLSRPVGVMLWAFPFSARLALGRAGRSGWIQRPWRALSEPVTATLLQAAALWLWHLPSLFDLALQSPGWHIAQHLSFLVTALLFWSSVLARRHGVAQAVGSLFLTSLVTGALGAFMALSSSPWYARYAALGMNPWGLTPAEDQQLAGLLMWVPGGLVHALAALWLLGAALKVGSSDGSGQGESGSSSSTRASGLSRKFNAEVAEEARRSQRALRVPHLPSQRTPR